LRNLRHDWRIVERPILGGACVLVLCGILTAGLWPFFPPKNQVSWSKNGRGLLFGDYATAVSSGDLNFNGPGTDCAIELWLQPGLTFDSNTILDVYTPEVPFKLRVRQSADDLVLLRDYRDENDRSRARKIYVDHAFQKNNSVLITISADAQVTSVYLDGRLMKTVPHYGLTRQDLAGQLILGAAPVVDDRWSGNLLGLAVYSRDLTPQEVLRHYMEWTHEESPRTASQSSIAALYTFSEGKGNVVHNQAGSNPELTIPNRFTVSGQAFLVSPWKEYSPGWSYYKYIIINIAGFAPLGFFCCAYMWSRGRKSRRALNIVLFGGLTSLTIEVLQAYIPTRQSGMTDLITNTFGSYMGVVLFQCGIVQNTVARLADASSSLLPSSEFARTTLRVASVSKVNGPRLESAETPHASTSLDA
jgi:hypothetical protein